MSGATRALLGASRIGVVLVLVHALTAFGCAANEGGGGGSSGFGGVGGAPLVETSTLRVAHVAVGGPGVDSPELDFNIADQGSFNGISFGRATQLATLPSDVHQLSAAEPGRMTPLANVTWELEADVRYTVAAYRERDPVDAIGLFIFDERIDGLELGRGRVLIAHGAADSAWGTLNVVDTGTNEVIAAALAPGDQAQPIDLAAGSYELGLSISSVPPTIDAGPFLIDVAADETTVLILIDEDPSDGSVEGVVYVLEPTTVGAIPAISLR